MYRLTYGAIALTHFVGGVASLVNGDGALSFYMTVLTPTLQARTPIVVEITSKDLAIEDDILPIDIS